MPKIKSSTKSLEPKTEGVVIDDTLETTPVEDSEIEISEEDSEIEIPESVIADDEVEVEENVEQLAPVKSVRICPNTDHSCSIGGVRYFLKKGVCQNVPVEVKEIFVKAGLLSPL